MNEYDSQRILDLLAESGGYRPTEHPEQADLFVLNTCSIREKAQEKLFHQLGQWKRYKAKTPMPVIAVGGCVAMQEGEAIRKRAPYVDILFGPQSLHKLPELLKHHQADPKDRRRLTDLRLLEIEKFDALPTPSHSAAVSSVTIMEGCDKFCAYCIVPYTRGGEVCRPQADLLEEIRTRIQNGAREIVLLGQNVNAWRERTQSGSLRTFAELLERVCEVPELHRVRFLTSHPTEFGPDLVEAFGRLPKLGRYVHLPVQSGSDRILAVMGRGHPVETYRQTVRALRAQRPDLAIGSDFIVGFPGETDQDFEKTLELVETVGFDISYSFVFSPRPGTPAESMEDLTPFDVKKQRLYQLQRALSKSVLRNTRRALNQECGVLVEGSIPDRPGWVKGRNEYNRWVHAYAPGVAPGTLGLVRLESIEGSAFLGQWLAQGLEGQA